MKHFFLTLSAIVLCCSLQAQSRKTSHVVVVTLDGMRWQEIFGGVDSALMNNAAYTKEKEEIAKQWWSDDAAARRKKLFPFLWSVVAQQGQLYGNRQLQNYVNVTNPYWFSYPGYNEIFTGYPDTAVNSNDKVPNRNESVLEFINRQQDYRNRVAVFSTWDVFPYIFNKQRSGVYVNADTDSLRFASPALQLINDIQFLTPRPIGVRPDVLTYMAAREYLKAYQPKVLYIAFDETDDFAHAGLYDQYLKSAHAEDGMLADLWNTLQAMPEYRNQTTLIVTCDHGRGDKIKDQWRDHGKKVEGSDQIWIAAIGPDTKALGEVKQPGQVYQRQLATTIGALLGFDFKPAHPVMPPIESILSK